MPYNSIITRSEASALIPEDAAREILSAVPQQSAVAQLARRLPDMPRNQRRLPVVSALPTAYWINPSGSTPDNGLKQTSEVNWTNVYINAEELAVIVPIPEAVLDDADYDVWGEIRPLLVEAFGREIDKSILRGVSAPSAFPDDLSTGATNAGHVVSIAGFPDVYSAMFDVGGLYDKVEEDGFMVTGHVGAISMMSRLRGARTTVGEPVFAQGMVEGVPFYSIQAQSLIIPRNGSMTGASELLISGDWSQLVWAVRQDISYKILDQAVIQDSDGNITHNLAQQDMLALRATMRMGWALPNPINPVNTNSATRYPFAVLTA